MNESNQHNDEVTHARECRCSQCLTCDATSPRQFEQSAARFNDASSHNILAADQNFLMQQQANWLTLMQATKDNAFASHQQNLRALNQLFR